MKSKRRYPLDNSAIIHFATRKKWYSNSYRIAVTLKKKVNPELLQQALERVVPRFPTIAAGIEKSFFKYHVVPVAQAPKVMEEREDELLCCMTPEQIEACAFRILYHDRQISGEMFHSLTDGHGALVFMKTLVAEYLKLEHQIEISSHAMVRSAEEAYRSEEIKDDFFTFASRNKASMSSRRAYMIPAFMDYSGQVMTTSLKYDVKELLQAAKHYRTSLTVLLTAVMAASIAEIQKKNSKNGRCRKPVQIMVPINLRNLFPSKTLRNFSLYALPSVGPEECSGSVTELVKLIEPQIRMQSTPEFMAATMGTQTRAAAMLPMKIIPLSLKIQVLKHIQNLYGEPTSCLSLSNLGKLSLPKEMEPHVERIEVILTPRVRSPYNCSVVTFGESCYINFSRFGASPELELCFTKHLQKVMAQ